MSLWLRVSCRGQPPLLEQEAVTQWPDRGKSSGAGMPGGLCQTPPSRSSKIRWGRLGKMEVWVGKQRRNHSRAPGRRIFGVKEGRVRDEPSWPGVPGERGKRQLAVLRPPATPCAAPVAGVGFRVPKTLERAGERSISGAPGGGGGGKNTGLGRACVQFVFVQSGVRARSPLSRAPQPQLTPPFPRRPSAVRARRTPHPLEAPGGRAASFSTPPRLLALLAES